MAVFFFAFREIGFTAAFRSMESFPRSLFAVCLLVQSLFCERFVLKLFQEHESFCLWWIQWNQLTSNPYISNSRLYRIFLLSPLVSYADIKFRPVNFDISRFHCISYFLILFSHLTESNKLIFHSFLTILFDAVKHCTSCQLTSHLLILCLSFF